MTGGTRTPASALTVRTFDRPTGVSWNISIDPDGHSGAWNMAADYDLLLRAQAGETWLRLYRWDPACLSFGRNEPSLTRYDRDRISDLGLDTVRRPTGGRAVWHDREVTYAVAAPIETFGTLVETYSSIHSILAQALRRLGIDAAIAPRPANGHAGLGAGSCFASPAGGEVVVGNRKLIGSAQIREGRGFLQHGSILLEDAQDVVSDVTRGARLPPVATSVTAALNRPVSFEEIAAAIAGNPSAPWHGAEAPSTCTPGDDLVQRFAAASWTWRR